MLKEHGNNILAFFPPKINKTMQYLFSSAWAIEISLLLIFSLDQRNTNIAISSLEASAFVYYRQSCSILIFSVRTTMHFKSGTLNFLRELHLKGEF